MFNGKWFRMAKHAFATLVVVTVIIFNMVVIGYAADGSQISKIIAGYDNAFVVTKNGELFAAGKNTNGQLGNGTNKDISKFTSVLEGVSDVSSGGEHTLFLMNDNSLWSAGYNTLGQLGNGTNQSSSKPVKVMDNCISFSAGYSHSMAVDTTKTLFGWGYNGTGVLADGTTISKNTRAKIADGIKYINAGMYYNLAIKDDGSICILPDNGLDIVAKQIVAGKNGKEHTLVLSETNELFGFGYNAFGQLGNSSFNDSSKLLKIMDNVSQVAAGASHSMALKTDKTLWVWGSNANGQLGNGSNRDQNVPVKIMDDVVQISASANQSIALKSDGSIYVWGSNNFGQFGNGTNLSSNVPVLINVNEDIASSWAYAEVSNAKKSGLVPSTLAGKYRSNITRQEFAALTVNLYERSGGKIDKTVSSPFVDTKDESVAIAYNLGIVKGVEANKFSPDSKITRQEMCVMMLNTMKAIQPNMDTTVSNKTTFADSKYIAPWANDAVQFISSQGIIKGVGENMIEPLGNATREQSIMLSLRIFKKNN